MDDMTIKHPTYLGDENEGPLIRACKTVFRWPNPEDLIVVIWHEGWNTKPNYWAALRDAILSRSNDFAVVVTFFGGSLSEFRTRPGGHLLPLLFRLLNMDPEHPAGCCSITDFCRLGKAPVNISIGHEVRLSRRANAILGLSPGANSNFSH